MSKAKLLNRTKHKLEKKPYPYDCPNKCGWYIDVTIEHEETDEGAVIVHTTEECKRCGYYHYW